MKKILFILIIAALFINSSAYAEQISLDFSARKPFNAAVRSALMPGWGQGWNEQPTKGWITFGVFAVSVAGAFYFNSESEKKYEKYQDQGLINGDYYNDYESNRTTSQVFTFVAIGTWLYGVIDAYFTCKSQNSYPKTSSVQFFYDQKNDGLYLSYSKKIAI